MDKITQIQGIIDSALDDTPYWACIYGSYANKSNSRHSDIDLFVTTQSYDEKLRDKLVKKVVLFHINNRLGIDEEVPYENKIMCTFREISEALLLKGFEISEDTIKIPPVVKSQEFLNSQEVKYRLILNALTTPHIPFGKLINEYDKSKRVAENSLTQLILQLLEQRGLTFSTVNALEVLYKGESGEEGELYLGYKNIPTVKKHLISIVEKMNPKRNL